MTSGYAWGNWEERWDRGLFSCVFVQAYPEPDGMIHATGLYHATNGDSVTDIDTFQEQIADRAAILGDGDGVLVKQEFAELLAIMPAFLHEASRRIDKLSRSTKDRNISENLMPSAIKWTA